MDDLDIDKKNLDNIDFEFNLFGEKIYKLSIKDRIGFLPISVWEPNWQITSRLKNIIGDYGQTRTFEVDSDSESALGGGSINIKKMGSKASHFTPDKKNRDNNFSIFNPHLAQMLLSAYCPQDAVIFDPFAGGGTRGIIASAMGFKYYGIEIRKNEVARVLDMRDKLNLDYVINLGDGQTDRFGKDNFFDFCYTCPPYYDLEVYSNLENDLSNAATYEDFLVMIYRCLLNVYAALKDGKLAVFVVGNFRDKEGYLKHFSGDLVRLGEEAGFKLHMMRLYLRVRAMWRN